MDGHEYTAAFEAPGGRPVLAAYPDPLTGAEPWTIGLGHTGADVHQHTLWTADQCRHAFYNDYSVAQGHAAKIAGSSCWLHLNEMRRAVVTDMTFNIGPGRLAEFHKMLDAIRAGNWQRASEELLDSAYAKQVKGRAIKNAHVLLTGQWPGEELVA